MDINMKENRFTRKNKKHKKSRFMSRETRKAWFFLLPSLSGVILFVLLPFGDVVRRSFLEAMNTNFVGFRNYQTVLSNHAFKMAVKNTARFLGTCIPLLLIISLGLALLINFYVKISNQRISMEAEGERKGQFFKTSYLIPMAIPVASVVLLWKILFHQNGLVNVLLSYFGRQPIDFMNTSMAFDILVFSYLWKNAGYDMILWLAGLDGISNSLYEAAGVDGAGALAKFRYITLPALKPTLFITLVLSVVNSFKVFREAYLIGGDYPNDSIYMLQHLFNNWFVQLDIQKMTAAAVMTAGVVLVVIALFFATIGKGEKEDD